MAVASATHSDAAEGRRMNRIVTLLAAAFADPAAVMGQPVSFRDPGLKAAVEAQLHVTKPTAADMLKLM
jgi:hypothetical protein